MIALHAAVLAPERVDAVVLSDPYFPALRHLEDVSRWGHWQNFRQEAASAGVELSDEHWYDLGKFFDQVLHLDGERLLKFRQAVGLPALNRLLRLGRTTCGDDSKVEAGLTAERIAGVALPVAGPLRRILAVPGHGRVPRPSTCRTAARRSSPAPSTGRPRRTPRASSALSRNSSTGDGPSSAGSTAGCACRMGSILTSMGTTRSRPRSRRRPVVLLTGAAQGIGRATASALAARGYRLGLLDRAAGPLERVGRRTRAGRGDRRGRRSPTSATARA